LRGASPNDVLPSRKVAKGQGIPWCVADASSLPFAALFLASFGHEISPFASELLSEHICRCNWANSPYIFCNARGSNIARRVKTEGLDLVQLPGCVSLAGSEGGELVLLRRSIPRDCRWRNGLSRSTRTIRQEVPRPPRPPPPPTRFFTTTELSVDINQPLVVCPLTVGK